MWKRFLNERGSECERFFSETLKSTNGALKMQRFLQET
jgi:hypothetical protein